MNNLRQVIKMNYLRDQLNARFRFIFEFFIKVLGSIPKCQKCGGGRPRYDNKNGKFQCPGYMEDTEFKHCRKVY